MSLSSKEKEFYEKFKNLLREQGINETHPKGIADVLMYNDYIGRNNEVFENVSSPAFIEPGENSPFLNSPGETSKFDTVAQINAEPDFWEKRTNFNEAQKNEVQQEVNRINNWCKENIKNPFDPEHKPSERHIKKLYKAYQDGRLCLANNAFVGNCDIYKNVSFICEDKDGNMKLTPALSDIQKELKAELGFELLAEQIYNVSSLKNEMKDPKMKDYMVDRFGEQIVADVMLLSKRKQPKAPGFLTRVAGVLGFKNAKATVAAYDNYEDAKKNVNHAIKEIAKKLYPGVKNPVNLMKTLGTGTVGIAMDVEATQVRAYMIAEHRRETEAKIAQKIEELAGNRSELEKNALKFALQGRYNANLSVDMKRFLKNIPDLYREVVVEGGIDVFGKESVQDMVDAHQDNPDLQKKIVKLDAFNSIYKQYAAGDLNVGKPISVLAKKSNALAKSNKVAKKVDKKAVKQPKNAADKIVKKENVRLIGA